jgi:hypothetical protein
LDRHIADERLRRASGVCVRDVAAQLGRDGTRFDDGHPDLGLRFLAQRF